MLSTFNFTPMVQKETAGKSLSHDALQALCYQWHVETFPEDRNLVHANLSNSVGGRYGSHNRAIGVKKGRSDLQYYKAGVLYLFEFKVGQDSQKATQKQFQADNEAEGAKYYLIRSLEEYQKIVWTERAIAHLSTEFSF